MDMLNLPYLAVVKVDALGTVLEVSGNWERLGFQAIRNEEKIDDVIDAFGGYFPITKAAKVHLPYIRTANDKYINFDIIPAKDCFLITALDVTKEALISQELQQVRNEIDLLKREIFHR